MPENSPEIEIDRPKFIGEKLVEGLSALREPDFWKIAATNGIIGLGHLLVNPDDPGGRKILSFLSVVFPSFTAIAAGAAISRPFVKSIAEVRWPELKRDKLKPEQVLAFLSDPAKVGAPTDFRLGLYPLEPYRKRLIKQLARQAGESGDGGLIVQAFSAAFHPELKLYAAQMIKRYCSEGVTAYLAKQARIHSLETKLEEYLSGKEDSLNFLQPEVIFQTAGEISQTVIAGLKDKQLSGPTIDPFVKLYVLRRVKEAIGANRLPEANNQALVEEIEAGIERRLRRFHRAERELGYDPEAATSGLEMQPDKVKGIFFSIHPEEVWQLNRYAGFRHSLDEPFEVVLPPTRTPVMTLLLLGEILQLTGVPIEHAGIHINFGGLGKSEHSPLVKALQRIILGAGRLKTDNYLSYSRNIAWAMPWPRKGEVSVRRRGDWRTEKDIIVVTHEDQGYPELHTKVAELRASVGAESFYVFCRGLFAAHDLANLAKAKERQEESRPLSGREEQRAQRWDRLCNLLNRLLNKSGFTEKISDYWEAETWQKFAALITDGDKQAITLQKRWQKIVRAAV